MNKIFRIILGLAVLGFFIWILNFHLIFLGRLKVVNNFTSNNSFISDLVGALGPVKDLNSKKVYQEIRSDQASSNIYIPPYTEKLEVKIKAFNPDKKIFYSYEETNGEIKNFLLQEEGLKDLKWELKEVGDYSVLYNPEATEPYNNVRTYYAPEVLDSLILEKITQQGYYTNINLPLRGDHSLNVYISDDGILDLEINFQQRVVEDNKVKEKIGFGAYFNYQNEEILFNQNTTKDKESIKIYQENLDSGIYKLEFSHDNDITLENIKTHNFFTIKNKLVLNDPNKLASLYTNSSSLYFSTAHSAGEQELELEEEKINIKLKETVKFENNQEKTISINPEHSDFEVKGSGGAQFIPGDFNEEIIELVLNSSQLNLEELKKDNHKIEYIVFRGSDYFNSQLDNILQTDNFNYMFELDPKILNIDEDRKINLNLIIPNHQDRDTQVKIYEIQVTYYRSFWKYLRNYLQ